MLCLVSYRTLDTGRVEQLQMDTEDAKKLWKNLRKQKILMWLMVELFDSTSKSYGRPHGNTYMWYDYNYSYGPKCKYKKWRCLNDSDRSCNKS